MDRVFVTVLSAMGSFFVVTIMLAAFFLICKSNSRKRRNSRSVTAPARLRHESSSLSFDPSLPIFSMEQIECATSNFSPDLIVGDGSFGLVYRAKLSDGRTVAVKKLDPDAFQGLREFRAEIETLGTLRHPNLARILGFCERGPDRILIYEFVERGNLDSWLHDEEKGGLPWATRVAVAQGVAAGLAYLHSLPKPIIHRDIKASNVLLDADFSPRISDFGLARRVESSQSHVMTQVAGTMGYMPPEYKDGFTLATLKADVYSFGVLMLEVVVSRRPNLPVPFEGSEVDLACWARRMVEASRHMEMLDYNIPQPLPNEDDVLRYLRTALLCASELRRERPNMKDVLGLLVDT